MLLPCFPLSFEFTFFADMNGYSALLPFSHFHTFAYANYLSLDPMMMTISTFKGPFSALRFSHGEGHVLYCAERNVKTAQYYDADLEWDNDEKILESNVVGQNHF